MLYLDTASIYPLLHFNQIHTMVARFPAELAHRVLRAEDASERARRAGAYVLLEKMAKKHTEAFKTAVEGIAKPEFGAMFDSRAVLQYVRYDSYGKPYFAGKDQIAFNLSHSDNLVACVLSIAEDGKTAAKAVGVDIQRIPDRVEQAERIAERYFSLAERTSLPSAAEKDAYLAAFSRLWTRKEAYLKCIGVGISQMAASDTEEIAKNDGFSFPVCKEIELAYTNLDGKEVFERYFLSVCVQGEENLIDYTEHKE